MLELLKYFHDDYSKGAGLYTAYDNAVKKICQIYDCKYRKISDDCRRKLGLDNIKEFHDLLKKWTKNDTRDLIQTLKNNSASRAYNIIEEFFEEHTFNGSPSKQQETASQEIPCTAGEYSIYIDSEKAKKVSILSILDEKSVSELLTSIINEQTNKRLKNWAKKIVND